MNKFCKELFASFLHTTCQKKFAHFYFFLITHQVIFFCKHFYYITGFSKKHFPLPSPQCILVFKYPCQDRVKQYVIGNKITDNESFCSANIICINKLYNQEETVHGIKVISSFTKFYLLEFFHILSLTDFP